MDITKQAAPLAPKKMFLCSSEWEPSHVLCFPGEPQPSLPAISVTWEIHWGWCSGPELCCCVWEAEQHWSPICRGKVCDTSHFQHTLKPMEVWINFTWFCFKQMGWSSYSYFLLEYFPPWVYSCEYLCERLISFSFAAFSSPSLLVSRLLLATAPLLADVLLLLCWRNVGFFLFFFLFF